MRADLEDSDPRPVSTIVPLCAAHIESGARGAECLACRVERYEATLNRLADPLSALTLVGVMQLARDAVRPRGAM